MTNLKVARKMESEIDFDFEVDKKTGSVFVTADGERVIEFTQDGYMRRLPVDRAEVPEFPLRRLDDGRIAIKPKK